MTQSTPVVQHKSLPVDAPRLPVQIVRILSGAKQIEGDCVGDPPTSSHAQSPPPTPPHAFSKISKQKLVPFMTASWLAGMRKLYPGAPKSVFFEELNPVCLAIIDHEDTEIVLCNGTQDPDQYYGFAVVSRFGDGAENVVYLHYIYVKDPFRGFGIGKRIMQNVLHGTRNRIVTTVRTDLSLPIIGKNFTYSPTAWMYFYHDQLSAAHIPSSDLLSPSIKHAQRHPRE